MSVNAESNGPEMVAKIIDLVNLELKTVFGEEDICSEDIMELDSSTGEDQIHEYK